MRVIFLDNDGVICLSDNWGSRHKKQKEWIKGGGTTMIKDMPVEYRFDNFDVKAIKVLNSILITTGAEIVVSSDWRLHATLEELGEYYTSKGIIKKPIDVTERFHYTNWEAEGRVATDFPWNRTDGLEQERHFEIKEWLKNHPEVTHWVAVDDLNMGVHMEKTAWGEPYDRSWGLENFVLTPSSREGIKQSGIKEKILKYLAE
jgi:hypothetical protein